jgi:hypothetical protein
VNIEFFLKSAKSGLKIVKHPTSPSIVNLKTIGVDSQDSKSYQYIDSQRFKIYPPPYVDLPIVSLNFNENSKTLSTKGTSYTNSD